MGESSGLFDGGVVLVETTGSDTLNDFACVRVGDVGAGVDGATTGRDLVIPLGTPLVFACTSLRPVCATGVLIVVSLALPLIVLLLAFLSATALAATASRLTRVPSTGSGEPGLKLEFKRLPDRSRPRSRPFERPFA